MKTDILKTLLTVQANGSFADAARVLDVDPSSVSRLVRQAEAELGFRLFQRTTRSLSVTEEGQLYFARLAPLLDELEAAKEAALGVRSRPTGRLRMTASVAFSTELLVPLLPAFQAAYPDVVVELTSSDAALDLVEQSIDLAIRLAPAPSGDLIATKLMPTTYRCVAAPAFLEKHPMASEPTGLAHAPCLRYGIADLQDTWWFRRESTAAVSVAVDGMFIASSPMPLREAARHGAGVAMLADWLVRRDLDEGRLVDVFPEYQCTPSQFDTAAWALYPSRTYLPQKVRVMIDFLRAHLGQPLPQ